MFWKMFALSWKKWGRWLYLPLRFRVDILQLSPPPLLPLSSLLNPFKQPFSIASSSAVHEWILLLFFLLFLLTYYWLCAIGEFDSLVNSNQYASLNVNPFFFALVFSAHGKAKTLPTYQERTEDHLCYSRKRIRRKKFCLFILCGFSPGICHSQAGIMEEKRQFCPFMTKKHVFLPKY